MTLHCGVCHYIMKELENIYDRYICQQHNNHRIILLSTQWKSYTTISPLTPWWQLQQGSHLGAINSLDPGRPGCHFKTPIFNLVLLIGILTSSNDNALGWMPRDLTDDKSTLVQVMAWCHQATSHYLSQCWPSSMPQYGVTRPQWVNSLALGRFEWNLDKQFSS